MKNKREWILLYIELLLISLRIQATSYNVYQGNNNLVKDMTKIKYNVHIIDTVEKKMITKST